MVLTPLRNDVRLYEGNIADQGRSLKSWYPEPLLGLHGQLSVWLTSVSRPSGG